MSNPKVRIHHEAVVKFDTEEVARIYAPQVLGEVDNVEIREVAD